MLKIPNETILWITRYLDKNHKQTDCFDFSCFVTSIKIIKLLSLKSIQRASFWVQAELPSSTGLKDMHVWNWILNWSKQQTGILSFLIIAVFILHVFSLILPLNNHQDSCIEPLFLFYYKEQQFYHTCWKMLVFYMMQQGWKRAIFIDAKVIWCPIFRLICYGLPYPVPYPSSSFLAWPSPPCKCLEGCVGYHNEDNWQLIPTTTTIEASTIYSY